jgi:hypothetical protein
MESALTISPPSSRAIASARADLPLAVGPAIRTAETFLVLLLLEYFHHGSRCHACRQSVKPRSDTALGEAAFNAVDGAGLYWLADGVACDIALKDGWTGRRRLQP